MPAAGDERGRDGAGRVAGPHPSADERGGVQARSGRLEDDHRFRRLGPVTRTAAAALAAYHCRYSRGRPRHMEQLEAPADQRTLRCRRAAPAARLRAARALRTRRRQASGGGGTAGDGRSGWRSAAAKIGQAVRRCLLDSRARRHHRAKPDPAGCGPRCAAARPHRILRRARGHPGDRDRGRSPRAVLPHRRGYSSGRRQHHRCANSHRAQRHGGRQFPGPGSSRAAVLRRQPARPDQDLDRRCHGQPGQIVRAADRAPACPPPRRCLFGQPQRRVRQCRIEPLHRDRGQRA